MIFYTFAVFIGIIVLVLYLVAAIYLKVKPKMIAISCVFIAYLTAVASITLFPIDFDDSSIEYCGGLTWYNFIPFKTINEIISDGFGVSDATQIFGNILLGLPFGVFVLFFLRKPKWWVLILLAFSLTVAIEMSQMLIGFAIGNMYRNVDIDDIILNSFGTFLGYGVYKLLPSKIKETGQNTESENQNIDTDTAEIEALIEKRTQARKNKDWATADAIRDELNARNVVIKDTPNGIEWSFRK